MSHRSFTMVSALLAASLGLAACGGAAAGPRTLKIISSLPMTGASLSATQAIVNAEKLKLDQINSQVCGGRYSLSYEAWNDALPTTGQWDPAMETSNGNVAAAQQGVIAYLGPFNSGAAEQSLPPLNSSGPVVMISPANTYPGLTQPGFGAGEPDIFYPTHARSYARLVPTDTVQGAADARFVKNTLGASTVYVLDDQQVDGKSIAGVFEKTAGAIGLKVLGHDSVNIRNATLGTFSNAADYKALMTRIAASNNGAPPEAIFVGMAVDSNAAQLLKDKVAVMGDNTKVKYVGSDGVQTQGFIDEAGAGLAEGVYASAAGLPYDKLPPAGQQFKKDYDAKYGGSLNEPSAVYGYEAMSVLVAALESVCAAGRDPSDRLAVTRAVLATKDFNGALGTWSFDANGDTSLTDVTLYQVQGGKFVPVGQFK
jgi:branched-chain amino acid transport system substrate-binding protein